MWVYGAVFNVGVQLCVGLDGDGYEACSHVNDVGLIISVGLSAWLAVGLQGLKADLGLRFSTMLCELCSIG